MARTDLAGMTVLHRTLFGGLGSLLILIGVWNVLS